MDCNKAKSHLEFVALGHDMTHDPDAQAVQHHLVECPSCRQALQSQREFEMEIAQAMTDVAIPMGMKDRIRHAVGDLSELSARREIQRSRPGVFRKLFGAIAIMIPVLAVAWLTFRVTPLTEAEVMQLSQLDIETLQVASVDSFPVPVGWNRIRGIQFGKVPLLAKAGKRQFLVLPLEVRLRAAAPSSPGFLIRLTDLGDQYSQFQSTSLGSAQIRYSQSGCWIVWHEGNVVYLCVLRDPQTLERLRNAVVDGNGLT